MIEMGKKYQTRDGRAVRILATDFKAGATCVIGAITMTDTNEIVGLWNARGEEFGGFDHLDDLIPVPTKHEGWGLVKLSGSEYVEDVYTHLRDTAEDATWLLSTRLHPEQWHVAHVTWED